jgi:transposase
VLFQHIDRKCYLSVNVLTITRKKTLLYAQAFQEKHRARRQHFLKRRNQAEQEKRPRVYIDETDFASSTCRLWAHAPIGRPAQATHNAQQRPRTNLIAGHCEHKLIAPMLFEGNCNTLPFNDWLEQILLPGLFMGSIILTGNATFRKSQKIMDLIWDAGCTPLFLSPYCPDLNPVEKLWANLKRQWRHKAQLSLDELIKQCNYF